MSDLNISKDQRKKHRPCYNIHLDKNAQFVLQKFKTPRQVDEMNDGRNIVLPDLILSMVLLSKTDIRFGLKKPHKI